MCFLSNYFDLLFFWPKPRHYTQDVETKITSLHFLFSWSLDAKYLVTITGGVVSGKSQLLVNTFYSSTTLNIYHCRISTYRLLERGAFNDASTSNCFARSVLRSGPHASMPSSRGQAAYGGPSMSCLAVGVYCRLQISACRTCTVSSTTRSPEYVLPLLTPIHRLSFLPQSAVCCGCFQLSHLLMSWRQ